MPKFQRAVPGIRSANIANSNVFLQTCTLCAALFSKGFFLLYSDGCFFKAGSK